MAPVPRQRKGNGRSARKKAGLWVSPSGKGGVLALTFGNKMRVA